MHFAETAKFAIKVLLVSVFVFGAVAVGQPLLSGIFATLGLRMRSTWWRLALSVDDIVVDKNGTVYIWNGERIQVYDSDGRFLNGWSFGKTGWLLLGQDGASIIAVRHYRSSVRLMRRDVNWKKSVMIHGDMRGLSTNEANMVYGLRLSKMVQAMSTARRGGFCTA